MMDRDPRRSLPPILGPQPGRCRFLRWKTMYIDREDDPAVPDMVDGFVWCVHTMNCLGPDGEVAGHDLCGSTRRCHSPARSAE